MDVLFLHPPPTLDPKKANLSFMSTIIMGYGMLSVAAFLKREGFDVECWNMPAFYMHGLTTKNIIDMIKGASPQVVGIELNWLHFSKGAIQLASEIKKLLPNVKILLGGVHQTIFAEYILKKYECIDGTCIGEAEKTFLSVMEKKERGKPLMDVKGIIVRENGRLINTGPPEIVEDIDQLPPYSLRIVKPKLKPPFDFGMINTCRGPCIYSCKYCIGNRNTYSTSCLSPRTTLTVHSPDWIIAQLKYLLRDVSKIAIQDYIYCRPKVLHDYALEIQKHQGLIDKIDMFNLAVLPGSLSGTILHDLSLAGVDSIDYGIETGSEKLLRSMNRQYSRQTILKTLSTTCKNGIRPVTYWMVGLPRETQEDMQETKQFIIKTIENGGIPRWVTPVCIFPTLELYERASEYGITPKFKSFEEFMVFSETTISNNGDYTRAITHEMQGVTRKEIMNRANELKKLMIQNSDLVLTIQRKYYETYAKYHPKLAIDPMEEWLTKVLKSLKSTFF
ncbi:MAG: B12-binding domain-containing radical SAM protein [Candidatus Helarchaeota archaeon]